MDKKVIDLLRNIASHKLNDKDLKFYETNDNADPVTQYEMGAFVGRHYAALDAEQILEMISNA